MSGPYDAPDIADQLPLFLKARADGDAFYEKIAVLIIDPGDTESDILQKLAVLLGKDGKIGVVVFILPIDNAEDDLENKGNGPLKISIGFQVWENRLLNKSSSGTNISGYKVARYTFELFKHFFVQGLVRNLVPDKPAIERVPPPEGKKLRGWGIAFTAREDNEAITTKVGMPVLNPARGAATTVTITCPTGAAAIYYTTDGSPPTESNPEATLYTEPIEVPEDGFTLFVNSFLDGSFPSNVVSATFTKAP